MNDLLIAVSEAITNRHRDIRVGQAAFNVLHDLRPDIANKIRGTMSDPFNVDSRLPQFYERIIELF